MDNYADYRNVIFNKENNEVEGLGTKFICDGLIAQTISVLRKKGYETSESCSGHGGELFVASYETEETLPPGKTIKDFVFDQYMQGNHIQITSINGNKIKYNFAYNSARTYIFFSKKYKFDIPIPKDFELIDLDGCPWVCVQRYYPVMKEDGTYRIPTEIDKEIKEANEDLFKWAQSLSLAADLRDERKI